MSFSKLLTITFKIKSYTNWQTSDDWLQSASDSHKIIKYEKSLAFASLNKVQLMIPRICLWTDCIDFSSELKIEIIDAQSLEIQGGPWGFGQILLKGLLAVIKKSGGSPCCVLLNFYDQIYKPYPLPPCVHLWLKASDMFYYIKLTTWQFLSNAASFVPWVNKQLLISYILPSVFCRCVDRLSFQMKIWMNGLQL